MSSTTTASGLISLRRAFIGNAVGSYFVRRESSSGTARLAKNATTHLAAQTFIRRALDFAVVDAPDAFLGLLAGGRDHFSACVRLDFIPALCRTIKKPTSRTCLRIPRADISDSHTLIAELLFHGLDVSAFLVIWAASALALWRRLRDQWCTGRCNRSPWIFCRLILLFAISVTGLALTVSQHWLAGRVLQLPRDPARYHGDRRPAVSALWKVLPHLSAAGSTGREALSGAPASAGEGAVCEAMRQAVRIAACISRI